MIKNNIQFVDVVDVYPLKLKFWKLLNTNNIRNVSNQVMNQFFVCSTFLTIKLSTLRQKAGLFVSLV